MLEVNVWGWGGGRKKNKNEDVRNAFFERACREETTAICNVAFTAVAM
jgi:hypothetical protein